MAEDAKSNKEKPIVNRQITVGGEVSSSTFIIGDSNTILIRQEPKALNSNKNASLTRKWLTSLYRLRNEKQISSQDYLLVLSYALQRPIDYNLEPQAIEMALAQCTDLAEKLYWELSDAEQISNLVVTQKVARVHQILTAIQLNLNVVVLDQNVRFVLIPPGTTRTGVVNHSCFYLAETILTKSDWARIMNMPSENSLQPRLGLSLNDVRYLLNCANKKSCGWTIPSTHQWTFVVEATDSVMPRQRSLTLKSTLPSSLGVYDLLGVAWQFTQSHKKVEVQGGSYFTNINSNHEIPLPEIVCGTDLEGDDWGFRPALSIG